MQSDQILDFIRMALSAEPDKNKLVEEYWNLLNGKYSEFAREEDAHDDDAAMLKKMQDAGEKFEEIARFKSIKGKRLGAIGGRFSSGKSAFINSLMLNTSVRLKTEMKPTTAIPTYVCRSKDDKSSITGYSYIGNKSARFDIPAGIFEAMDHDFLKKLQFNLRNIIPYITVSCPMEEKYFDNICLIDTPGYDPPESGFSLDDYNTAIQHIATADFLIWIVNIEGGTIDNSDLEILGNLHHAGGLHDLYIIANKADRKTENDIDRILDDFETGLGRANLEYSGICAYASGGLRQGTIFQTRGKALYKFFEDHNFQSRAYIDLENSINEVFDDYKNKLEGQRENFKNYLMLLKKIDLDWAEMDTDKDTSDIRQIQKYFSTGKIEKHLKMCEELRSEFLQIIGRLDFVEKYAHIKTIPQLINYFGIIQEKTQESKSGKNPKLLDSLAALVLSLNMIYTRDFSVSILKQITEKSPLFMSEIGSWIVNAIAAEIRYMDGNSIGAEKLLKEICREMADIAERVMNDHADEKATFSYESIFSDILEQGFFTRHNYSKNVLEKIGLEIRSCF